MIKQDSVANLRKKHGEEDKTVLVLSRFSGISPTPTPPHLIGLLLLTDSPHLTTSDDSTEQMLVTASPLN